MKSVRGIKALVTGRHFQAASDKGKNAFAEESAFAILPSGEKIISTEHQIALYSKGFELIHTLTKDELYNIEKDPEEKADLSQIKYDIMRDLYPRLIQLIYSLGKAALASNAELIKIMGSLGYIK